MQSQQTDTALGGAPIIGTWVYSKSEAFDKDNNPVYNDLAESDFESTIELKDDGNIVINMFDTTYTGQWETGEHGRIVVSGIQPNDDRTQPVINSLCIYTENDTYYMGRA